MEHIKAVIEGRDELAYSETDGVKVIGCSKLVSKVNEVLKDHGSDPAKWPLPLTNSHEDLLVKELILKAQGNFKVPYTDVEICHCRSISTDEVLQAIKAGAHNLERIRALTDANTACGTCGPDCESLLDFMLKPQNK